jgi:hypothetical protein
MEMSTFYNPLFNTLNIAYLNEENEIQVVIHRLLNYDNKYHPINYPFFKLEGSDKRIIFSNVLTDSMVKALDKGYLKTITNKVEKCIFYHSPNRQGIFTSLN